ncbi:MAG: hypothetical protein M1838_004523 [Thelocarpon superellum]|nr:MAG: hypothetical protein M1838_004523 [Thelocarpon superellum]
MADLYFILTMVMAIFTILTVALVGAWYGGYLEPIIVRVTKFIFIYKAKAEEKALEAQGKKAGVDFVKGDLHGNKQADAVENEGLGALKKL